MDDKERLRGIKGLMSRLLRRNEHTSLTGQAAERAAAARQSKPKSMTPHDHLEYEAWQRELDRLEKHGPGGKD